MFKKLVVVMLAAFMFVSVLGTKDMALAAETTQEDTPILTQGEFSSTIFVLNEAKIPGSSYVEKKTYTNKQLKWMATIIFCEAGGQCKAGKLAVGNVIMNRVRSNNYPNSIYGVIKQPHQFGPYSSGKLRREMKLYDKGDYNKPERKASLIAAKEVLTGKVTCKYRGKKINLRRYHNFNGHLNHAKIRISGHDFK